MKGFAYGFAGALFGLAFVVAAATAAEVAPDEVLAVEPGNVEKLWVQENRRMNLPGGQRADFRAGCATLSFIIEPTGKTSNVRVLRSIPEGDVAELSASVVRAARYVPTKLNKDRAAVYTYTTVTFNFGQQPETPVGTHVAPRIDFDALDSACAVSGFGELKSLDAADG